MYTQSMPALVKALTGVLPPAALKQLTQALGNCNQPLTHRGQVNVQAEQYAYDRGLAPQGTWNPGEYQRLLPTSTQAGGLGGDIVLPGFGGSGWNSFNFGGDSFFFPTEQAFNQNMYYGGPTFNVGGNVSFDNTQTNTLTAQQLITENITIVQGPGGGCGEPGGVPAFPAAPPAAPIPAQPPPAQPFALPRIHVIKDPTPEEFSYIDPELMDNVPNPEIDVPDNAISGGYTELCIPENAISGVAVSVDIPQGAISGVNITAGTVSLDITGGYVSATLPSNAISGGTVSIGGIPTNAISGGTVSITGLPSNAISGGTVSIDGIPTNAISGGTVAITGVPQAALSGGTVAVILGTTTSQIFAATGATLNPETCTVSLLGATVTVVTAVGINGATLYGITATTQTITASLATVVATTQPATASLAPIAATTQTRTASLVVTAASTAARTGSVSGTSAAVTASTLPVNGLTASATLSGITAAGTTCTITAVACTTAPTVAPCTPTNYTLSGTAATLVAKSFDIQVLRQAAANTAFLAPVAQSSVRVYGP